MVASPTRWQASEPIQRRRDERSAVQRRTLQLIQGSLSGRRLERRAPWIAGLHRATDGTLVGLGVCMLALSALTLYWQNQWGVNYQKLEASQMLEHKLQESAALLEQHHLGAVRRPGWLVPTSSNQLIYLPSPRATGSTSASPLLTGLQLRKVLPGY